LPTIQKIIDSFRIHKIEYNWTEEDRNEQKFEYRKGLKPSSYTYDQEAIYRVRDPHDKSKEYYLFQKKGMVLNDNDDPEYSNSLTYGFAIEPVHELRWNPKTERKEPSRLETIQCISSSGIGRKWQNCLHNQMNPV
jgi:hypothetical protein